MLRFRHIARRGDECREAGIGDGDGFQLEGPQVDWPAWSLAVLRNNRAIRADKGRRRFEPCARNRGHAVAPAALSTGTGASSTSSAWRDGVQQVIPDQATAASALEPASAGAVMLGNVADFGHLAIELSEHRLKNSAVFRVSGQVRQLERIFPQSNSSHSGGSSL